MFTDVESQLAGIQEIFDEARREDNWKADEDMLYSYYFVDTDVDKLEKLGEHLESKGFDFIDIFELGDEETEKPTGEYLLHIDKVETHTPLSLAQQNVEFARLAEQFEIAVYDGWEFGELEGEDENEDEAEEQNGLAL
ncbi:MAG: ribonuclease E inhibitor RraB [Pyrinomonadaceae bacterium]